jgi:error-prone DNA polymerase
MVAQAALLGLPSVAITDRHGVYGLPRAFEKCRELEGAVRLLCGAQVTVHESLAVAQRARPGSSRGKRSPHGSEIVWEERARHQGEGPEEILVLLVAEAQGWKNLCRLLTVGAGRADKAQNVLTVDDVARHSAGLLALWGLAEGSSLTGHDDALWRRRGAAWKEAFDGRLYAGMARHHLPQEKRWERLVVERAHRLDIPLVAVREVLYHQPERRRLQDVVTCIRHGCSLSEAGTRLKPNADFDMLSEARFRELYSDRPEAVRRTLEVAERCQFGLNDLRYRYPDEPLPQGKTSAQWLRELAFQGARQRYGEEDWPMVQAQLEKELRIITSLDYVGYFLTMHEIVGFCRRQGILCQGRGSAANSIVCFCLGITAVDPHKLGLLFERFISEERAEPPDIDLDIMHQRREEVIAWVYQRYGREHAAMVCNVVRYRPRSAVREIGKVLRVETPVIERLARLMNGFSQCLEEEVLEAAGVPKDVPLYKLLLRLVNEIVDFPRHLSIHPGGFMLGSEPVCHLVPIENATMEGRTVIQWDKYDVESLGLFKVDLLGLGALSQLDRAFRMLKQHRGVNLSMENLPVGDQRTFDLLCLGDSVGIFQVESRAQMAMLPSMRPRCFYDLVIQVAIIRPGPITGGMVHPYLRRRAGEEAIEYPHPSLEPVLKKTLGIPLFQEQVMRLAVVAADYTPGEADQLRRDMAAWSSRGKLERHRERLLTRMMAKGIEEEFAERVFAQIKGFGEYGFPESHAASFALITYATSYLRCHYPAEFTCSLLNSLPMGFYSASTLLEDAKRKNVEIRPFCAEKSQWECTLERVDGEHGQQMELLDVVKESEADRNAFYSAPGYRRSLPDQQAEGKRHWDPRQPGRTDRPLAIRLGLKFLKGLSEGIAERIVAGRPFRSVRDLTLKAGLDRRALEVLASAGALDVYGRQRRTELWAVDDHLLARALPLLASWEEKGRDFAGLSEDEEVIWDYEVSGLSSRGHPMRNLRPALREAGFLDARQVTGVANGKWAKTAAMVICRQRPATAKGTVFLTLEDETGFVNVILWPKVFDDNFVVARSAGLLAVEGPVQSGRGVVHLVARKLYRPQLDVAVEVGSRNFH